MSVPALSGALAPYAPAQNGGWSDRDAKHLLLRTQHGASAADISQSTRDGLNQTLERLTSPQPEPEPFLSTERLLRRSALDTGSAADLKAWWLYRLLNSSNPLREKMTLFWHNHFATSIAKVESVEQMAVQNDLIRQHALGDFGALLHGMTRDVAMLVWLDGNANRKRHPNENFAREVMELFSLGVGNYTEKDIQEAARAFTGWHLRDGVFWFNSLQHDTGTKTVLGRTGNLDGGDVIDVCLAQPACPKFLAVKLLKQFVMPDPHADHAALLAERIRIHKFVMAPVLKELFGSQLFFSPPARGTIIKSPLELVLGAFRTLECQPNLNAASRILAELGQDVFAPPTVKGWEGGRLWISSTSLLQRANFAANLLTSDRLGTIADPDVILQRHGISTTEATVEFYAGLLLASEPGRPAIDRLQQFLHDAAGDRTIQLRGLIHLVMTMPDYQLV